MKTVTGIVLNPNGLTSRLSAQIVAEANKYKSALTICVLEEEADLKSIMNVMALVVPHGCEFSVKITGNDENAAAASFEKLLRELNLKE